MACRPPTVPGSWSCSHWQRSGVGILNSPTEHTKLRKVNVVLAKFILHLYVSRRIVFNFPERKHYTYVMYKFLNCSAVSIALKLI